MRVATFTAIGLLAASAGPVASATLEISAKIPLPGGTGRIDHLAFDAENRRLFIAELGNGTVAVVDTRLRRLERRLDGFREPQGVAYFSSLHRLYVAEGGDGTVRSYDTNTFKQHASTKLAGDADNIRLDPATKLLYVGYGDALALLDAETLKPVAHIPLKGHPESFQLSSGDGRIYVNVPDAKEIAVLDLKRGRQVVAWPTTKWGSNYPMLIDDDGQSVVSAFRSPARIARFSTRDGALSADAEICGDADDVFIDARRSRLYVICGAGVVDVLDRRTLKRIDRVATSPGARTGLYSEADDMLFLAVRASDAENAAVWILKPSD